MPFTGNAELLKLLGLSDAASGTSSYGQNGSLTGIMFKSNETMPLHHIDCPSSKQNRVSFSSVGAEILAAANTADRTSHLSETLAFILSYKGEIRPDLSLFGHSNGIFTTILTLHEVENYLVRPMFAHLRDSLDANEIITLAWIPVSSNLSDTLSKINPHAFRALKASLCTGLIPTSLFKYL